jgi:hypothetical protein
MKLDIETYRGEAPRITPRNLPDTSAQAAVNARMQTGDLESWRQFVSEKVLANGGPVKTIYLLKDKWLSWTQQVDVARGLIAGDTTYLTFLTCPAIYSTPQFTTYALATTGVEPYPVATRPLGVPPPISAPAVAAGVDSTPTTFSIDTTDDNASLATKWIKNANLYGATSAYIDQDVGAYRVTFDENRNPGQEAWAYRNFGVAGVTVLDATADFFIAGDYLLEGQASMIVCATSAGSGIGVNYSNGSMGIHKTANWGFLYGRAGIAAVACPGVSTASYNTMRVQVVLNADATKTVTATILNGVTVLGTLTATSNFDDGDMCGFGDGVNNDLSPFGRTYYKNYRVQASGSAGYVPVNTATSYVYTFVNDLGWESAPSDPSLTILRPDGVSVSVTTPTIAPVGTDPLYAITTKRIYREVTGATGTALLLVAERPLAEAVYVDVLPDNKVGPGVLQTELWDLPHPLMEGIIHLPNGVMAGFFRNQLCFSVAGYPFAWPLDYRKTTDTDIVSIANIDNTVVIGTKSFVYTATGNDPANYSMSKPGEPQSCVSKTGMVYLDGYGVMFPSPDGYQVCAGSAGNVKNATELVFTKDQWKLLDPSSILAAVHDGVLHFWFTGTTPDAGYAYDTKQSGFGLISLGYHATAAHVNPISDELYLALDLFSEPTDAALPIPASFALAVIPTIYQFNAHATAKMIYRWRSKLNLMAYPTTFHFAKIQANDFTNVIARFYVDGVLLYQKVVTTNSEFRIPEKLAQNSFEMELIGTSSMRGFQVAQDVIELI